MLKDCATLNVNANLIYATKPGTIFELGTYKGGHAMWLYDQTMGHRLDTQIYAYDIDLKLLDPLVTEEYKDQYPRVHYVEGDLNKVEDLISADFLSKCPHPWIIFEDSHVNMHGMFDRFDKHGEVGDYIVCEDLNPFTNKGAVGLAWWNRL